MATAPIIRVKLEASDEREAIARFIEYTFDKNWVVQDVIDAIRNGLYLEHVRKLISAENSIEIPKEVIEFEKKAIDKFYGIDKQISHAQQSVEVTGETCPECGGYFNQVVCEVCGYH